jgi:hypothetical protein
MHLRDSRHGSGISRFRTLVFRLALFGSLAAVTPSICIVLSEDMSSTTWLPMFCVPIF